jgi:hypothetical protein
MNVVKKEEPPKRYVPEPEPVSDEPKNKKQVRKGMPTIEEQVANNIETIIKTNFSKLIVLTSKTKALLTGLLLSSLLYMYK